MSGEKRHHTFKITKERVGGNVSTVPSQPKKRRACSEITVREKTRAVREERRHAHALSFQVETKLGKEATQKKIHQDTHMFIRNVGKETMEMTSLTFRFGGANPQ